MKSTIYYIKENVAYIIYEIIDFFQKKIVIKPIVNSEKEAIEIIINNNASLSRFGDGELNLIQGKGINFQQYDSSLSSRLKNILISNEKNMLICIPDIFDGLEQYVPYTKKVWTALLACNRKKWCKLFDRNKTYYNAFISRPYIIYEDKIKADEKFNALKKIWNDKDVIIVEGDKSKLGVGNDLFDNVKDIKRIICPSKNAFSKYNEIIEIIKLQNKSKLILLALGPTATVLAFDLNKLGYQAIDIGHVDIEYEWFLAKATGKEKVQGKYTNEAIGGEVVETILNENYINEIIQQIL